MPVARTQREADLYLALTPCEACGRTGFTAPLTTTLLDGELHFRYADACAGCGTVRVFVFRAPQTVVPELGSVVFGGPEPSELLDPGAWTGIVELAEQAEVMSPDDYRYVAAALDEVRKFIPPGADEVPLSRFRTDATRAVHSREPGRFRRDRLIAAAEVYRRLAAETAEAETDTEADTDADARR
jgi:hypothetical protein